MRRSYREHSDAVINKSGHLFVGALLMIIGFLFLLDTMNILDTGAIISRGWPLIILSVGLIKLMRADGAEERLSAGLWIFIGSIFFLSRMGYLPFSVWGLIWPTALIAFGFYLVVRSRFGFNVPVDSASRFNSMAVMGGIERKVTSQQFEGGEVTAIMGGCGIDLREASILDTEATIEVFVLAGGVEIFVPEGWSVVGKVVPIMAGFEDRTKPSSEYPKRLIIRGLILMGGVEVKNY
jgi:predicted membrane protein